MIDNNVIYTWTTEMNGRWMATTTFDKLTLETMPKIRDVIEVYRVNGSMSEQQVSDVIISGDRIFFMVAKPNKYAKANMKVEV